MPYGIPKKVGGDSPENVRKMDDCVNAVMKHKGYSKSRAIAICKSALGFTKKNT